MRAEKAEIYEKLKSDKSSKEYEEWFLKYRPGDTESDEMANDKHTTKKRIKTRKKSTMTTSKKHTQKNKKTKSTRSHTKRKKNKTERKDRVAHYLKKLMGRNK